MHHVLLLPRALVYGALLIALVIVSIATSQAPPTGTTTASALPDYTRYRAEALRVIDGDTLELWVHLGLDVGKRERVRLVCVDTPEVTGPTKPAGLAAKQFAQGWVNEHVVLTMHTVGNDQEAERDRYGRLLAVLRPHHGGQSLNQALLDHGHASLYMCKDPAVLQ